MVCDIALEKGDRQEHYEELSDKMEMLKGAEQYTDIRQIYWMLYCDLKISIRALFPKLVPNWSSIFSLGKYPKHWINLRYSDVPALKVMSEYPIKQYEKGSEDFRLKVVEAVKGDCVSDSPDSPPPQPSKINEPKPQPFGTTYKNHLILIPKLPIKQHQNIIIWYDANGKEYKKTEVTNDPFDFIYYLAWLKQNGYEKGLYYKKPMSLTDKNSIIPGYSDYFNPKRFISEWTKGSKINLEKKPSFIKSYFNTELIKWSGSHYHIRYDIAIELKPYPPE